MDSVVIVGGREWWEEEEGVRRINGNGKKYNKKIKVEVELPKYRRRFRSCSQC